jgi:hypothetical protein
MQTNYWRRELTIALAAFGFGFLLLPFLIYWLGVRVLGDYAPGAGVLDFAESIWADFLRLRPAAWMLVLGPYVIVQALRLLRRIWQTQIPVTPVTNPDDRP